VSNDYRNSEGYPTLRQEKLSPGFLLMRDSPFALSGLSSTSARLILAMWKRNVAAARRYAALPWTRATFPSRHICLYPQFLNDDDEQERELGLFFGNALMSKCAEVWVFGSRISSGMEAEIKRAKWKDYHLRYFTEECQED
jgi:hypothetical protein